MAFTQGIRLDAVLCLGMLASVLLGATEWTDTYTVIVTAGIGKSVLSGIAAWLKCRAATPRPPGSS